ncbi:MAG TPA: helix-turn-helix transcriptional regulator [Dehalococcoidales bacterium]|nr:helix-turn-helix transcriptional regulator [Dehalococcoidales bacterium]
MEETIGGLGQWLRERCKNEHLSLRQIGGRAGLSHSTVHTIIKGGHASAETVTKLAHAFGRDGNRKIALEDELLILAGYRTRQEHISQPLAELLDIVNDFSEPQLRVVSAFATYLTEVSQNGQR